MDIPTYEQLLNQIKTNFWVSGMPYGSFKLCYRFYFLLIFLTVMVMGEISYLVSKISSENFLELTQLAPCICTGVLSILKFITLAMKRHKIFALTECLGNLYKNILDDIKKRQLVRDELVFVKYLMKYFFILNAVLISVYNFSTVIFILYHYLSKNEWIFALPYAVLLPFSTDVWLPWLFVYIHSVVCGFICVLYFTTVDALYCVLTTHVCVNFTIISTRIECLNANDEHLLKDIVKDHQYILKLAEDLEDIFTGPNLFNVMIGAFSICALEFNLTMGDVAKIPGCVLFLLSVLLQMLMMSVFGENLIQESKKVGDAAYLCKWYNMNAKAKKCILTIMLRSHKPTILTAYKFSAISYGSFCKIISTSWSYFTILRTVYTPLPQEPNCDIKC